MREGGRSFYEEKKERKWGRGLEAHAKEKEEFYKK